MQPVALDGFCVVNTFIIIPKATITVFYSGISFALLLYNTKLNSINQTNCCIQTLTSTFGEDLL